MPVTMFEEADLIHRYTRADAIRDGVIYSAFLQREPRYARDELFNPRQLKCHRGGAASGSGVAIGTSKVIHIMLLRARSNNEFVSGTTGIEGVRVTR